MQHPGIPSSTSLVKDSLIEKLLTTEFLTKHNICADETGVKELIELEKNYQKMSLNQKRINASLLPRLQEFLKQRKERIENEKLENEHQARMQDLAMELSRSSEIALTAYRNEQHIMRFPIFSTSKENRIEPIRYEYIDSQGNRRYLVVRGAADLGIADQRDGDVIRYALTKMGEIALQTGFCPPCVKVSAYEILKAIGKGDSKRDYDWLLNSMRRISSSHVETNIFTSEPSNPCKKFMGTLASFEYLEQDGIASQITISLSSTLFISTVTQGLLRIDKSVLIESGNLRKALLERIQVHMGRRKCWSVATKKLAALCAFEQPMKRFKEAITRANLPYDVQYHKNSLRVDIATFTRDSMEKTNHVL